MPATGVGPRSLPSTVRLHQPGVAVTSRRPAPRGTGPRGLPEFVPGSESTLIDGGSLAALEGAAGAAFVGSAAPVGKGGPVFAAAAVLATAAVFDGPRPFQPSATPAPSARTARATPPSAAHALLRARGAD